MVQNIIFSEPSKLLKAPPINPYEEGGMNFVTTILGYALISVTKGKDQRESFKIYVTSFMDDPKFNEK